MTNQRFFELAPKIDNRYLELTGKPYELSHKKGKTAGSEVKAKIYPKIAKEFGVTEYVVRAYLRVYHLHEDCLRDMESGRPWTYYEAALNAPEVIRQLAYQKIKDNEFLNRNKIGEWIRQYKNIKPKEKQGMKISPLEQITNVQNQSSESFAEQLRELFRVQEYVDVEDIALKRIGRTPNDRDKDAVISTIYNIRKSMEKELGRKIVREGNIFSQQSILNQTIGNQQVQDTKPTIVTPKTKTAVLVVREVRDENGVRYELDVVGEFNRGMMKEALKQLMEVFI